MDAAVPITEGRPLNGKGVGRDNVRTAFVELACLILLIEFIEWIVPAMEHARAVYTITAGFVVGLLLLCYVRDRVSARDLGIRLDNLLRVLGRISLPLILFVAISVGIGFTAGTLRFGQKFYSMLVSVPFWAFAQQYMLLAFTNRRLRLIVGPGSRSVVATAVIFSVLHLPNVVLTPVCALGGYIWVREYERDPNLLASALTHTVASAFLANSFPPSLLKNMVVGLNYFFR